MATSHAIDINRTDMNAASRIAAHRGGSLEKPENTIEAFRYAIALGVEELEFDVHLSADAVPVIHHDATLDRMTDSTGPIEARTIKELRAVRIKGSAEAIPTLEEALEVMTASAIAPRVEIKPGVGGRPYSGLEAQVIAALARFGLLDRTTITSFVLDILRSTDLQDAHLPKILLVESVSYRNFGRLDGVAHAAELAATDHFALPVDELDEALVSAAFDRGLTVSAFGAHTEGQIARAVTLGLPVFTSDRPHLAREIRARLRP